MNEAPELPSNAKCTCGHDSFYHRRADGVCLYKEPGGYQCGCQQFTLINTGSATNLSCGNCKTIRPFSGQPLKCDVCGWQVSEGKWQVAQGKIVPKKNDSNAAGGIIALVIVAAIGLYAWHGWADTETRVLPVSMHANSWIAGEYRTCVSLGKGPDDVDREFSHDIADMLLLDCTGDDTSESHDLQVKFTKPIFTDDGEKKQRMWNCQRQQSGSGTSLDCQLKKIDNDQK